MIELTVGKSIALLLWAKTPSGKDDVVLLVGRLTQVNGIYFVDRGPELPFEIREEWIPRIVVANPSIADVVGNANYLLSLSVGSTEGEEGPFLPTGLKWPETPA